MNDNICLYIYVCVGRVRWQSLNSVQGATGRSFTEPAVLALQRAVSSLRAALSASLGPAGGSACILAL